MARLFQKIASALARPFQRDLRERLDRESKRQKEGLRTLEKGVEKVAKELARLGGKLDQRLGRLNLEHTLVAAQLDQRLVHLTLQYDEFRARFLEHALVAAETSDWIANGGVASTPQRRLCVALDARRLLILTEVGYVVCDRTDAMLVATLLHTGDLERGLRHFLHQFLRPGMTFVDVGANIGMHTLAAGRTLGSTGRVHAFEPTPATAGFLEENVRINGLDDRVRIHPVLAGAAVGEATLYLCPVSGHNTVFATPEASLGEVTVPMTTLDVALEGEGRVDLVKIDVEGAEMEVFAGMRGILASNPEACVVAEFAPSHLARSGKSVEAWAAFCAEHGFSVLEVTEPDGELRTTTFEKLMRQPTANILLARGKHVAALL